MSYAAIKLESPYPQKLAEKRSVINERLHIKKTLSYRLFSPHCGTTVLMRDVWAFMLGNARNGATFDPALDLDHLLTIDQCQALTGWSRAVAWRVVKRAPHFRFSERTILIKRRDFVTAVEKSVSRYRRRRCPAAVRLANKETP